MDNEARIFGDPADFAIEAGVEPTLNPPSSVWGFMRLWCRGVPIGDFQERFCALYPSYCGFVDLIDHIDELWDESLNNRSEEDILNRLDELLYGYHGDVEIDDNRSLDEMKMDWNRYGKFDFLTNWGEQFDGCKSFLLCPPGDMIVILSHRFPSPQGLSLQVSKRAMLEASRDFVHWLEVQEQQLRGQAPQA